MTISCTLSGEPTQVVTSHLLAREGSEQVQQRRTRGAADRLDRLHHAGPASLRPRQAREPVALASQALHYRSRHPSPPAMGEPQVDEQGEVLVNLGAGVVRVIAVQGPALLREQDQVAEQVPVALHGGLFSVPLAAF